MHVSRVNFAIANDKSFTKTQQDKLADRKHSRLDDLILVEAEDSPSLDDLLAQYSALKGREDESLDRLQHILTGR